MANATVKHPVIVTNSSSFISGSNIAPGESFSFAGGLSGSLQKTTDAISYLVAGNNITITSGSNGQITVASTATGGGDSGASYIVVGLTSSLSNERQLTAGPGVRFTDAGANGLFAISSAFAAGPGIILVSQSNGFVAISASATTFDNAASYLVLGATSSLSNERVFTAGVGIGILDGGAGSTYTISSSLLAGPNITIAQVGNSLAISSSAQASSPSFWYSDVAGITKTTGSFQATGSGLIKEGLIVSGIMYTQRLHITSSDTDVVVLAVTGSSIFYGPSSFYGGLSGSLQTIIGGNPYLVAGNGVTIVTESNGQITISSVESNSFWYSDAANTIKTTGSFQTTGSGLIKQNLIVSGAGTFVNGLSGSLQKTSDGISYLAAGNYITIVTGSNGQITIGSTGASTSLPEYLVGSASYGPGGISPQYAEPMMAISAAIADGHNSEKPFAVRVLPGRYSTRVEIPSGCHLYGASGNPLDTVLGAGLQYTFATDGGLAPIDVDWASIAYITVETTDTTTPLFIKPLGNKVSATLYTDNVLVQVGGSAVYGVRVETDEVAGVYANLYGHFIGIQNGNASTGQAALSVSASRAIIEVDYISAGSTITTQISAIDAEAAGLVNITPRNTTNSATIYGKVTVRGTSSTVTLMNGTSMLTENVVNNTTMFDVQTGGLLKLLGGHVFGAYADCDFLFSGSAGAGEVQIGGTYDLIGTLTPYKTASDITINGYYVARDERVQIITTDTTISADTTLAIVTPPDATVFTVTLPDATGWTNGRKLRVKYYSDTYKQNLDLAPFSGQTIDYSSFARTFAFDHAYHFAATGGNWMILSSHLP